MTAEASSPSAAPEIGAIARIPGALFSPGATFASIARRPSWVAPMVLWIVASMAVCVVLVPRMDLERSVRERLERSGQTPSEQQVQTALEGAQKVGAVIAYVSGVTTPIIVSLVVAVVLWAAFKAFGWDLRFVQAYGATVHAFVPGILGAFLLLPILANREKVNPQALGDVLRSNLGFLADPSSKALHSLLQSIDVFSFWSLALVIIGFAAAAKVSRKSSAAVILTIWLLYVLGKAGLAGAF